MSNLAGVFGIWLAQWHLHSPTELDFSFSSQGQGHKVTNLENVKKINKLGIELLGFSTVSNESWYASSALRVLQLSSFTFFPIPASLAVASPRRSKNKKGEPCTLLVNHRHLQTCHVIVVVFIVIYFIIIVVVVITFVLRTSL